MAVASIDELNGATPVDNLLARAGARAVVNPGDGKSGSTFERLVIDGERYFLKRLSPASDWIMRMTGDHVHRPYLIWRAGIMDRIPACIDHTVVAMQLDGGGADATLSLVMHDVGEHLVPEGDEPVTAAQHEGFLDHLAALCSAFWGWRDGIGELATMADRFRFFAPDNMAPELRAESVPATIAAADRGWRDLPRRSPSLARVAGRVHANPELLARPLAATPATFLHGDWKMGNLGSHPDGRTILLDWAYPGSGPASWDLWWYIALNRARLPEPKEATIARFRDCLEQQGVDTRSWWEEQLDLCLVGIMVTFAWEKALGDDDELRWWEEAVAHAIERCDLHALSEV